MAASPQLTACRVDGLAPHVSKGGIGTLGLQRVYEGGNAIGARRDVRRKGRRVHGNQVHMGSEPPGDASQFGGLFRRVIDAFHQRPFEADSPALGGKKGFGGVYHLLDRVSPIQRNQRTTKLVIGGMETHGKSHWPRFLGKAEDSRNDSNRRHGDGPS